jgi:hypothetical protein
VNFMKKYLLEMIIKKWKEFKESISGTELVGHLGPNYPDQDVTNTQISPKDTGIVLCTIDNKLYTYDDYQDMYNLYLKSGNSPLHGFNKNNLDKVVTFLTSNNENFNPKNEILAKDYVNNNIRQLIQIMEIDEENNIEDIKKYLIDYFTKYPEDIHKYSIETFGRPNNYNLRLNNIGGVIKYK